ncbi:MAG: hypothetical protein IKP62_01565 [Salinivirgaceae bacterium]|nr:hypothetical protein [Salinivirgaceae bacterium]
MPNVDSCFVCTTPYQVMAATNYVTEGNVVADIYIVPQFNNARYIADNIRTLNLFRNVVFVDTSAIEKYKKRKLRLFLHFGILINYLRIKSLVPQFHIPNIIYNKLYVSSKANIGRLMKLYYIKKKYCFDTIYFDDGESSYDNGNIINPTKLDYFLQRLLFGKKAVESKGLLLLYSPQLFKLLNPDSTLNVEPLPLINHEDKNRLLFNKIFDFSVGDCIKEKVIILDILKDENLLKGESEKIGFMYEMLIAKFGVDNTIIKRHPRDKTNETKQYKYYKNYTIPFELLLLNMELQNKLLVTVSSTAITIPKLLFGQEPKVIYLGNLVKTKQGNIANKKGYYEACRKMYNTPDYFMIPKTFEEFEQIIKNFSNN